MYMFGIWFGGLLANGRISRAKEAETIGLFQAALASDVDEDEAEVRMDP